VQAASAAALCCTLLCRCHTHASCIVLLICCCSHAAAEPFRCRPGLTLLVHRPVFPLVALTAVLHLQCSRHTAKCRRSPHSTHMHLDVSTANSSFGANSSLTILHAAHFLSCAWSVTLQWPQQWAGYEFEAAAGTAHTNKLRRGLGRHHTHAAAIFELR
jgi:hypothetical protein